MGTQRRALIILSFVIATVNIATAGDRERQILVECAASASSDPLSYLSCVGGKLAWQEVMNIFNGDAFGPNNEFVKLFKRIFSDDEPYFNDLRAVAPYRGGVLYGYRSGVYWSPDGNNPRGGGRTIRVYPGGAGVIKIIPFKGGVLTWFENNGVYYSPNGRNLGGGGATANVYPGTARILNVQLLYIRGDYHIATTFSNGYTYYSPDGRNLGGGGNTFR